MKTLAVILHITQNPQYKKVSIICDGETPYDTTPMGAIGYMASIDPSHYNDYLWRLNGTLEKDTLLIYKP